MDLFAFLLGFMAVPFVFLVHRDLLLNNRYFQIVSILVVALAAIALATMGRQTNTPDFYLFLFCPLYGFVLLRAMTYLFRKATGRLPRDTPKRSFDLESDGLFADRLFNLLYLMLATVVPVVFIISRFRGA